MMRTGLVFIGALFMLAVPAWADVVTSYQVQVYAPGVPVTGTPTVTQDYPIASVQCNQTPLVDQPDPVNPQQFSVADTNNPGKACVLNVAAFIASLTPQAGDWNWTITASNEAGSSARSAQSHPFRRLAPPSVPTDLRSRGL